MKPEKRKPARPASSASKPAREALESKGIGSPMNFSVVPLLLPNKDISAEARRALVENRLQDAARLLMQEHGLSCIETGHLVNVSTC
jgi:hypothetical protein